MKTTNKKRRAETLPVASLLADLYATLDRKCNKLKLTNPLGDRGTLVTRLIDSGTGAGVRLFVMEAGYRGAIFPRLVYTFPEADLSDDRARFIRSAIRAEHASPESLVAKRDTRQPVFLLDFDPSIDERLALDQHGNRVKAEAEDRPEVKVARAKRQLLAAERALTLAQEWLARVSNDKTTSGEKTP